MNLQRIRMQDRMASPSDVPTSLHLSRMLEKAEEPRVSLAWLMEIALCAALASLAITAATVWGAVETIDWIDPGTATAVEAPLLASPP